MIELYFFRGRGTVPFIVRLFCWRWWLGQKFSQVPAHCSAVIATGETIIEFEATVKGITCDFFHEKVTGVISSIRLEVPHHNTALYWLAMKCGTRYGFEAVAIDGISVVAPAWVDKILASVWSRLEKGRSSPLHCSLLCLGALKAGGYSPLPYRKDGIPISPNDLMIGLKT